MEKEGVSGAKNYPRWLHRAINFMQINYADKILLKDIASAACLSLYHFSRQFKRHTNFTCLEYLTQIRINKVKEMIRDNHRSITWICFEVGFESLSQFERVFKRIEKITPSQYKKNFL